MRKKVFRIEVRLKMTYRNEYVVADNKNEAIQMLKENEDYFSEITDISIELDNVIV